MACSQSCNQGRNCTCRQACELPELEAPRSWIGHLVDLLIVILGALLICYLVGVFGPALDSHHASEWPQSQALVDAQRAAVREFHKDMAAAKLCRQEHGESSFTWTAAGELVCIPRHGKRQLASNP